MRCRIRVATTFWRLNRCLMAKAGHFWGALRSCFRGELTVRRGTLMSPMRPHLRSRRGGGQRRRASCWRRSNGAGRRLRCSWRSGWAWSSWPARLGDVLGVPSEEKAIFGDDTRWRTTMRSSGGHAPQVDLLTEEEVRTPWWIKSVTTCAKRCTCYCSRADDSS